MQFELTEHQRAVRADAREFARERIAPHARALDAAGEHPTEVLDAAGDRGYAGLTLPERYGGQGEGLVELALVTEELSAELMPVASALALHLGVAEAVQRLGTDAQRERFLPEMAAFDTVGALGLSETNAGSDKTGIETTAQRDGEEWVLDGHKRWVTNLQHADEVLTYARTGERGEGGEGDGITAFLVPADAFEVETVWDTLGARTVKSPKATLSGVRVDDDRQVGTVGEGLTERGRLRTGINVPARGVGIARATLDDTVAETSGREQGGQRIADHQGVRWRVAEMAERVDVARLLVLRAAARLDAGTGAAREFAMAKTYATEAAVENANDALQLHGGIGYTTERDVERHLRDARLLTIAGGPNEGHLDKLADAVYDQHPR
ncbi:acyl-CoA dehydrogenase family protein [Haloglomus litoreum]|uniref:acyl-CoA dehydrogenase family protein n=1 Tax=Haloglomus litoreum TaxID=3034026 RepID=UPI0023E80AF7|nr:acyl-CoA dehydrogenase family protein [Haloglomus sp. DT116]